MLTPVRGGGRAGAADVEPASAGPLPEPAASALDDRPVRRRTPPPLSLRQRAKLARRWFRAFRRTRPFWGGLWTMLGGWRILSYAMNPLHFITVAGFSALSGWLIGGGLIACGLAGWVLPRQRYTFGVIGMLLAVVSLVASNLGGFFVGMLLGVAGSSMTLGWGVKKPSRRARRRAARLAGPAA